MAPEGLSPKARATASAPNAARQFLRFFQEPAAPGRMVIFRGL